MRSRFAEQPETIVPRTLKQLLATSVQEAPRRRPRRAMIVRRVT
ncbi:hypothetical protein [Spirillospora sp. NPDC029432]